MNYPSCRRHLAVLIAIARTVPWRTSGSCDWMSGALTAERIMAPKSVVNACPFTAGITGVTAADVRISSSTMAGPAERPDAVESGKRYSC